MLTEKCFRERELRSGSLSSERYCTMNSFLRLPFTTIFETKQGQESMATVESKQSAAGANHQKLLKWSPLNDSPFVKTTIAKKNLKTTIQCQFHSANFRSSNTVSYKPKPAGDLSFINFCLSPIFCVSSIRLSDESSGTFGWYRMNNLTKKCTYFFEQICVLVPSVSISLLSITHLSSGTLRFRYFTRYLK